MKVHGRCLCGLVTYEAEVDPARVSACHCTDCQMLTGSAYRVSVPAPRETFLLLTRGPEDIHQDRGERSQAHPRFLRGLRRSGLLVRDQRSADVLASRRMPRRASATAAAQTDLVPVCAPLGACSLRSIAQVERQ